MKKICIIIQFYTSGSFGLLPIILLLLFQNYQTENSSTLFLIISFQKFSSTTIHSFCASCSLSELLSVKWNVSCYYLPKLLSSQTCWSIPVHIHLSSKPHTRCISSVYVPHMIDHLLKRPWLADEQINTYLNPLAEVCFHDLYSH